MPFGIANPRFTFSMAVAVRMIMNYLEDFNQRLAQVSMEWEEDREAKRLASKGKAEDSEITKLEAALGYPMPDTLRDWYQNHGPFESEGFQQGVNTVCLMTPAEMLHRGIGLVHSIESYWGGRPEIASTLSPESIDILNRNTVVWGMRYINDNRCVYYYFHRDGGIGDLYLDQDDLEWTLEEMQAIARNQATTRKRLDTLLEEERIAMLGE